MSTSDTQKQKFLIDDCINAPSEPGMGHWDTARLEVTTGATEYRQEVLFAIDVPPYLAEQS